MINDELQMAGDGQQAVGDEERSYSFIKEALGKT